MAVDGQALDETVEGKAVDGVDRLRRRTEGKGRDHQQSGIQDDKGAIATNGKQKIKLEGELRVERAIATRDDDMIRSHRPDVGFLLERVSKGVDFSTEGLGELDSKV